MPTTTPIGSTAGTTDTTKSKGAGSLTSNDFMNLMIKQLQSQDPLNPTDSNALLQQIAQISTLQSNQALQTSLSTMTLQQSIGSAGNLIGKVVKGIYPDGKAAQGNVIGVKVENSKVNLQLDSGPALPMENVTDITSVGALTQAQLEAQQIAQQYAQQAAQLAAQQAAARATTVM